ncbi:hypothetical protein K9M16_02050 [Candidatus Babeliales bacterium]|nr:hypothetical protein [Candidatus Babeliales bacterium]
MKIFFKFFLLFFLILANNNTICAMESDSDSDSNFSTKTFYSDSCDSNRSEETESIYREEDFYLASIKNDSDSESSFASDSSDEFEDLVRDFVKSIKTLSPKKSIKKFSFIIKDLNNIEVFSILYEVLENKLKENPEVYLNKLSLLNKIRKHFIKKHVERHEQCLYELLEEIDNNSSITQEERELQKRTTIALNSLGRNLIKLVAYDSETNFE